MDIRGRQTMNRCGKRRMNKCGKGRMNRCGKRPMNRCGKRHMCLQYAHRHPYLQNTSKKSDMCTETYEHRAYRRGSTPVE